MMMELTFTLLGGTSEEAQITLVGRTATVPKEEPLHELALLQWVLETESEVLIVLQKVEQLGRGLHDGERGRNCVVDEDRDST